MKCSGETETLHQLVHDTKQKSENHELICEDSWTNLYLGFPATFHFFSYSVHRLHSKLWRIPAMPIALELKREVTNYTWSPRCPGPPPAGSWRRPPVSAGTWGGWWACAPARAYSAGRSRTLGWSHHHPAARSGCSGSGAQHWTGSWWWCCWGSRRCCWGSWRRCWESWPAVLRRWAGDRTVLLGYLAYSNTKKWINTVRSDPNMYCKCWIWTDQWPCYTLVHMLKLNWPYYTTIYVVSDLSIIFVVSCLSIMHICCIFPGHTIYSICKKKSH